MPNEPAFFQEDKQSFCHFQTTPFGFKRSVKIETNIHCLFKSNNNN